MPRSAASTEPKCPSKVAQATARQRRLAGQLRTNLVKRKQRAHEAAPNETALAPEADGDAAPRRE